MRERIARYLVYLDRSKRVLWYVQAWIIQVGFVKYVLGESGFGQWYFNHLLISLTATLIWMPILAVVLGYIEKIRYRSCEQEDLSNTDPGKQDVMQTLYDIFYKVK